MRSIGGVLDLLRDKLAADPQLQQLATELGGPALHALALTSVTAATSHLLSAHTLALEAQLRLLTLSLSTMGIMSYGPGDHPTARRALCAASSRETSLCPVRVSPGAAWRDGHPNRPARSALCTCESASSRAATSWKERSL